jgi:hypothetical protein
MRTQFVARSVSSFDLLPRQHPNGSGASIEVDAGLKGANLIINAFSETSINDPTTSPAAAEDDLIARDEQVAISKNEVSLTGEETPPSGTRNVVAEYWLRKLRIIDSTDASDFLALAKWAEARRLTGDAWADVQKALELDPDNGEAKAFEIQLIAKVRQVPTPSNSLDPVDLSTLVQQNSQNGGPETSERIVPTTRWVDTHMSQIEARSEEEQELLDPLMSRKSTDQLRP